MKKRGILNTQLISWISKLGHKDLFLIGDAGMPVPKGIPVVDLALKAGVPTFSEVLEAVVDETEIEFFYFACETEKENPEMFRTIKKQLPNTDYKTMSHDELKQASSEIKFAVRTGENTPYANVILRSGVVF